MPSEYDFLSPLSRRLRRAGLAAIGMGAFLAGAVSMAAIVALPLFPVGGRNETPATEAKLGAAQKPTEATPLAAKPETSATAHDATTKTPPVSAKPDTAAARRETAGLAGASAPDMKPANPPGSPANTGATATAVPAPTTQTAASDANGGASAGEASVPAARNPGADSASTPAQKTTGSEASPRAKKKSTASRTRRAHSERVARSRQREQYPSTWAFGERRSGREYVDGSGVRYFVVPRSSESAFAYDDAPRTRRPVIVRPGGAFYDD